MDIKALNPQKNESDDDDDEEFESKYETSEEYFGSGEHGIVYKGRRKRDNALVAVKQMEERNIDRWKIYKGMRVPAEVSFLKNLSCVQGVVRLLEYFEHESSFTLVMNTTEESVDLGSHLNSVTTISEDKAGIYIKQLIKSLMSCYINGIVHMNVNPENILIDTSTDSALLIGFGSAEYIGMEHLAGMIGDPSYAPPECFAPVIADYCEQSVVWSVGATLYHLVCGHAPYDSLQGVLFGDVEFPVPRSPDCMDIIEWCLDKNCKMRPSLRNMLEHPFLKDAN